MENYIGIAEGEKNKKIEDHVGRGYCYSSDTQLSQIQTIGFDTTWYEGNPKSGEIQTNGISKKS